MGLIPDWTLLFQSTPPARGATYERSCTPVKFHISIHAPREGGDADNQGHQAFRYISIHAPREGGDIPSSPLMIPPIISIHAPREGGDFTVIAYLPFTCQFQSTPPARGATSVFLIRSIR